MRSRSNRMPKPGGHAHDGDTMVHMQQFPVSHTVQSPSQPLSCLAVPMSAKIAPRRKCVTIDLVGLLMANVATKGRKHLSADALFRLVYTGFDDIPDRLLSGQTRECPALI